MNKKPTTLKIEAARLAALREYEILDTEPEKAFDDLARLATLVCDTPMAQVSFVDDLRQWCKARVGHDLSETPLDSSFCTHAILADGLLVVPDALEDERFADSPLVTGDPKVRFYAGAPLITPDGHALGTICVMDRVRRDLTDEQAEALLSLARLVMTQLEFRRLYEQATGQFYRTLEDMPDGIIVADVEGNIRFANTQIEELFGYSSDELFGQSIEILLPDRHRDTYRRQRADYVATPHRRPMGQDMNLLGRRKDGSEFPVDVSLAPTGRDGGPLVIAAVRDLTEKEQLEVERMKLAKFPELNPHPVIELASDGRVIFANTAGQELASFGGADDIRAALPRDVVSIIKECLRRGEVDVGRETVINNRVIEWTFKPVAETATVHVFGHDVTMRKRAERELQKSEENYRSLVEHSTYGIYRSSPDGGFLSVNQALVEMLGYESTEEMLDLDMSQDVYVDSARRPELLEQFKDADRIDGLEVEWKRKDGTPITVQLSGRPVRFESGAIGAWEMTALDVTGQRALETQLRQAQKMEAVGQLTGGIAHDFNNLLTVILSNTEFALGSVSSEQAELREDLEEVRGAANRGAALVKKLLGFSRGGQLELEPVDIGQLAGDTLGLLRRLLPESIEIQLDVDPNVGAVPADAGAVEQILMNLATNARDAMPDGGSIEILVKRAWLDAGYQATHPWTEPGEYVCLAVTDTGIGMDKETTERIFEPFFTTKPSGEGTGLGMAMVFGIVKQHGGYANVYSEPGQGTVVKIYFPVAPNAKSATYSPQAVPEELPGGNETILVVEDEEAIRRAAKRILEKRGYRVLLAADGEEALELFGKHESEIDLILSDLVMQKLGGRQLYEALKLEEKTVNFLFMSGYASGELQESTTLEADVPFLRKPWTVADLLTRVREVLSGPRPDPHKRDRPLS